MRRARPALVAALGGGLLLLCAAPASAAVPGSSTGADGSVALSVGPNDCAGPVALRVGDVVVASAQSNTPLSGTWERTRPNGTYTAEHLGVGRAFLGACARSTSPLVPRGSSSFVLAAPPLAPVITQAGSEDGSVTLAWTTGAEPDLLGQTVSADGGPAVDVACTGARCTATFDDVAPGTYSYVVRSVRNCPTCDGGRLTTASSARSATVQAPPGEPTPFPGSGGDGTGGGTGTGGSGGGGTGTGGGTGGGGTGTGTGGTGGTGGTAGPGPAPGTTGGTGSAGGTAASGGTGSSPARGSGAASLSGFRGFGSKVAVPGLPAPEVAGAPEAPDVFSGTLDYGTQLREDEPADEGTRALGVVGDVLDSEQLVRTLAGALVLLLAAAHLRRGLHATGPLQP